MSLERRLSDKVVLVTGVASGIGAACAERVAREGARLAGVDVVQPASEMWKELSAPAPESIFQTADVSDEASVSAAVKAVVERLGRIDGLVHCAAVASSGRAHELELAEWERIIDVDLKGTFLVAKHVLAQMVRQRSGSVVLTSSIEGIAGGSRMPAYNAAKGGVTLLTRNLAVDYGEYGIRVNCVCPGFVRTAMTAPFYAAGAESVRKRMESLHLLGRFAEPEEVAGAVYFLLSEDASFVTGHALLVDGGFLAGHRVDLVSRD